MSKSLDNYIGVTETPKEQVGKLMSISDAVMWRYYELLSAESATEIARRKRACASGEMNPRDAKIALAKEIVARYHDARAADDAVAAWEAQFSRREVPDDMPEVALDAEDEGGLAIPKVLAQAGLAKSTSDGRRRIEQGAVSVDGSKVSDVHAKLAKGGPYVVKAGKRAWASIKVR
jgi:tyrosyl-tRNA synthetase